MGFSSDGAKKMLLVAEKAQELLDAIYPNEKYRLTVLIATRDNSHDHGNFSYLARDSIDKGCHDHTGLI